MSNDDHVSPRAASAACTCSIPSWLVNPSITASRRHHSLLLRVLPHQLVGLPQQLAKLHRSQPHALQESVVKRWLRGGHAVVTQLVVSWWSRGGYAVVTWWRWLRRQPS